MDRAEDAIKEINADKIYTSKEFKKLRDNFTVGISLLCSSLYIVSLKQGRCNEGFNAEHIAFAFCISNLNIPAKIRICLLYTSDAADE